MASAMVMIYATLMPMEKPNVSLMTERSSTNGLSALKPMELEYASQRLSAGAQPSE